MKQINAFYLATLMASILLTSCGGGSKVTYTPEENYLNLVKLTDEGKGSILGHRSDALPKRVDYSKSREGVSSKFRYHWSPNRLLSVSPDGSEIAHLTRNEKTKEQNIMVRKTVANSTSTQRTFRDVQSFSWGTDGNLYFADYSTGNGFVASVDAHAGSLIRQHTNNNSDTDPILSPDGSILFFTRVDRTGPFIWSLDLEDGTLTSCARGFNPWPIDNESFICVRNSSADKSEIWLVNFEKGQETLILSDSEKGFTNPAVSPDGKWIALEGSSHDKKKRSNLDIFVVKIDGTEFFQLTYHEGNDCCPAWSADGKQIFFISSRGNKDNYYNIWRMNFSL